MRRHGSLVLTLLLLAGTAVAFATTERQKLDKTPFAVVHVTKIFSPAKSAATIRLKLHSPHLVTLQIINARDRVIATLAQEQRIEPGNVSFRWHGTVADGVYEPRVTLDTGRVFTLVNQIRADSVAPTTHLVSYRPRVLRKHRKRHVVIVYRVSEPAHVLLYVNGRLEARGGAKALQSKIEWFGRLKGRPLRRARYRLQLAAVDLAGNVGPRTPPFVVRIR